jgi:hypothetical protein
MSESGEQVQGPRVFKREIRRALNLHEFQGDGHELPRDRNGTGVT